MSIKKILAFTGIRSDYDLMSGLYSKIQEDPTMHLGLIVSGAHLSPTYGYTVQYIEKDKLPILARIESLIDSDTMSARLKSASIVLQNCLHTVEQFSPDIIIYPGDREDVMVGALVGAYLSIPTVHFFGGDHAIDGNVDNPIRHAASKLSSIHFVANEQHKQRLQKIGESGDRIYVTGSPALDKFITTPYIDKESLFDEMNAKQWNSYAVVIFHPIISENEKAGIYFEEILQTMKILGLKAFVSFPNVDAGNNHIIKIIEKYQSDDNFFFYKNLDRVHFINLLRHASILVGNSSAGLVEAPVIPLGVVNVGARQSGRMAAENVIFVDQGIENIKEGISQVLSDVFQQRLRKVISPYGDGHSIDKSYKLLKTINFRDFKNKWEDPLNV